MLPHDAQMPSSVSTWSADHQRTMRGFRGWLIAAAAITPMLLGCGDIDGEASTMPGSNESPGEMDGALEDQTALVSGAKGLPGRIQAEDYRSGGEGVGYHDTTPGNQGGVYRDENVDIQEKSTGDGYNVGWITAGEWLAYDVSVGTAGTYAFTARVASGSAGTKKLHIEIDGKNVGAATFTDASGWQSWIDVNIGSVALTAGTHTLKVVADTAGFNVNYLDASLPDNQMWIGAAVNLPDNGMSSFKTASSSVGPFRIRRSFSTGLPDTIQSTPAATDAANNIITFLSVKPPTISGVAAGTYDAKLKSLAKSFPTDHTTYLTMYHEPENDMTGPQFVAMFRRFYKVVKGANPSIKVGTVHMSYHWRPGASATANPADWWVGSTYTDFIGVDDYNEATTSGRTTAETDPQFQRWYTWASTKDKPLAVVEFGRLENPNDANAMAEDLIETEEWLKESGFFMFLYWHAIGDKNIDWRVKGAASKDAMRDIASRGLTGW
jgi:hypothetical protein